MLEQFQNHTYDQNYIYIYIGMLHAPNRSWTHNFNLYLSLTRRGGTIWTGYAKQLSSYGHHYKSLYVPGNLDIHMY